MQSHQDECCSGGDCASDFKCEDAPKTSNCYYTTSGKRCVSGKTTHCIDTGDPCEKGRKCCDQKAQQGCSIYNKCVPSEDKLPPKKHPHHHHATGFFTL